MAELTKHEIDRFLEAIRHERDSDVIDYDKNRIKRPYDILNADFNAFQFRDETAKRQPKFPFQGGQRYVPQEFSDLQAREDESLLYKNASHLYYQKPSRFGR